MGYIEKLNINYVNKVMPTVYDDSLSYYEVLSKILYKLNEVIENVGDTNLKEEIDEVKNKIPTIENSLNAKCEMKYVNSLPVDENLKNNTIYILNKNDNNYQFYFYINNLLIKLANGNSVMNSLTLTNNVSDNLAIS